MSQGCRFFGVSIDHRELRTRVGQWLQNPGNAQFMELRLRILPSGLYHHLKRYPSPPGGWVSYLAGMTWVDWGVHVEQLGEWVGPLEMTPTNFVLEEMGYDLRVNIFDPRSFVILGKDENLHADSVEKPTIMVMSRAGHYEWLRLRDS